MVHMLCVLLFFKRNTAYEMRMSDWSSDVCSSDLIDGVLAHLGLTVGTFQFAPHAVQVNRVIHHGVVDQHNAQSLAGAKMNRFRVGKFQAIEPPDKALH